MRKFIFFLASFLILSALFSNSSAQSLHHSRDLMYVSSPETFGKWAASVRGFVIAGKSRAQTDASFAFGLSDYVDFVAAMDNTDSATPRMSFSLKIGDPPFLGHHLGLMPIIRLPLSGKEKSIVGLRFIHVLAPDFFDLPTKFYLNYGYMSQDNAENESDATNKDFLETGAGIKLAISSSVIFGEFYFRSYLDFDYASFIESRFYASLGTRLSIGWNTSLGIGLTYNFSGQDEKTLYRSTHKGVGISIGLTKALFPGQSSCLSKVRLEHIDPSEEDSEFSEIKARRALTKQDIDALRLLLKGFQAREESR